MLDRDGVINRRLIGNYVRRWDEFEFMEGVLEAMPILADYFQTIVVVTNQQGIAKGIMTEKDLQLVHQKMVATIEKSGGRIDKVYYCKEHERDNPHNRKPNIGMAEQAQKDFPYINFDNTVMVGDSVSDMVFGQRLGAQTALLTTKPDIDQAALQLIAPSISWVGDSLWQLAQEIETVI